MNREKLHRWLDMVINDAEKQGLHVDVVPTHPRNFSTRGKGAKTVHVVTTETVLDPAAFKPSEAKGIGYMMMSRYYGMLMAVPKSVLAAPEPQEVQSGG